MRLRDPVVLPPKAFLRFGHGYSFDKDAKRRYDGAIVEIKVDGGPWRGVGGLLHARRLQRHASRRKLRQPARGQACLDGQLARLVEGAHRPLEVRRVSRSRCASAWPRTGPSARAAGTSTTSASTPAPNDSDRPTGSAHHQRRGCRPPARPRVSLALTWDDATTWVTKLRISGSPKLNAAGTQPAQGHHHAGPRERCPGTWPTRTFGGSGEAGARRVYAQVRDAAGNWSDVFSDEIELLEP